MTGQRNLPGLSSDCQDHKSLHRVDVIYARCTVQGERLHAVLITSRFGSRIRYVYMHWTLLPFVLSVSTVHCGQKEKET